MAGALFLTIDRRPARRYNNSTGAAWWDMQRMGGRVNLHTHGLHKLRGRLQPQHDAQFKRGNLTTAQPFPVLLIAGHA